jgi:Ca2+/Na+ antiporter
MIATYASAALICAVSLLVGRAVLSLAGRREWSWLEPAVGFGAVLTVTGALARAPGHGTSATLGLAALIVVAALVLWRGVRPWDGHARPRTNAGSVWREGLPVALVIALVLAIPFAVSGRWGLLGVGFNNDLGLHLAWAEWLRSGFGPEADPGYPLGPHGLAVATATVPGIGLGQAFLGEIIAIGVMTGLTALAALRSMTPTRRTLAAALVAIPYLAASYYAQAAFKELAEALLVLAFTIWLTTFDAARAEADSQVRGVPTPDTQHRAPRDVSGVGTPLTWLLPPLALSGGIFFAYSFAGIAWPVAILALWSLTLPEVRQALRPRALLRFLLRPTTLLAIAILAGLAFLVTVVGPFGFASSFKKVAGSNTYGPVSPLEALGVWPASNYRLDAAGGAQLPGLAGAIATLALLAGIAWWVRRQEPAIPIALGAAWLLYLVSLPSSGDYSQAKALIIIAPLAMLVIVRPLLEEFPRRRGRGVPTPDTQHRAPRDVSGVGTPLPRPLAQFAWTLLTIAFIGGAVYSSFLALRDAPVGPPGHGSELQAFLPILRGQPVIYAGQDRYAAYELLGADTHVPLVEFPDDAVSPNPEKPFDTGDAYSPIDFDSFSHGTLQRFPYVITGRAAWNSQAPPNFKRVQSTPSYVLWKRTGPTPENRHVLLEGTEAGASAGCDAPEIRILFADPGRAGLFPDVVIGHKDAWAGGSILGTGAESTQSLQLPPGSWNLSLQYFSPFDLTLSAPGFSEELPAALDGQRPNTISLGNNGQLWPAGRYVSKGGKAHFTLRTADASTLQSLTGYDGKAYIGELVAVPAEPHRTVPLSEACNGWIDWYESAEAP